MSRAHAIELAVITMVAAAAATIVPLAAGHVQWSWDAMNHHIYLGMIAERPRWHLDVMPASYQTYQYPYLYWPVYRMSLMSGSGAAIGAAWSAMQVALLMPPVWLICKRMLPETGSALRGVIERSAGCLLAFMSTVILIAIETTSNDLLASVPLLWALALGLQTPRTNRAAMLASALWGAATAFKLSNGLYLPLLLLWWWMPERPHLPWRRAAAIAAGAVGGMTLVYFPWGWQLWKLTGNPFYPYLAEIFGRG